MNKAYHVLSIIGSQSSGKSTLLNALFGTSFEELNRKKRVGQTTKGIWYSMDTANSMMIVDVEGSDSNEREERTVLLFLIRKFKEGIPCSLWLCLIPFSLIYGSSRSDCIRDLRLPSSKSSWSLICDCLELRSQRISFLLSEIFAKGGRMLKGSSRKCSLKFSRPGITLKNPLEKSIFS